MVVVVFVENGGHGSSAAAPLAKALFEQRFGKAPPETPADSTGLVRASHAVVGVPATPEARP